MGPTTPWGKTLEQLRGERSLRSLETAKLTTVKAYKRMLHSVYGPSVTILDRILRGWGYTWQDWSMAYEAVQADAPVRKPLPSEEAKVLHLSTLRPPDDLVLGDHQEGEEEEAAYLIVPDPCEIDIQQQLLRDPSPQAMKRLYYGYVLDKIDQGRSTLKDQYREVFAKKETTQQKRGKKIPAKS